MPKKKTKKRKRKKTTKSNVVKIQVEATAPKKKSTRRRKSRVSTEHVRVEMQPVLVENFVALQKVMINLSQKFENLNVKISQLLELFEASAKTLAKKDFKLGNEANLEGQKEIIDKITNLSEQNKIIAKGLTMLHERQETVAPTQAIPMPMPVVPAANPPAPIGAPKVMATPQGQPANQAAPEEQYKKSPSFKPLKK